MVIWVVDLGHDHCWAYITMCIYALIFGAYIPYVELLDHWVASVS